MESFRFIFIGIIISYVITFLFLLLFSIILVRTNVSEQYTNVAIVIISSVSILCGTMAMTRKIKKNGAMNGIIISSIYMASLYIISSAISGNYALTISSIVLSISVIALGILGGILGVNIKS